MSAFESEALTIRTYPYSEAHRIAVFLTREYGQVRGLAHGARSGRKSRFGSSLEPLTHVRLVFSRKENQELATIKSAEILAAHSALQLSLEINLHISYFAELLFEFSQEEEECEDVFRLTLAVLEALEKVPIELLARYFELWLLRLEGVLPALEPKLGPALAAKVAGMLKQHPTGLDDSILTEGERKRIERLGEELIEYHLEKRLKTKRMLKELL